MAFFPAAENTTPRELIPAKTHEAYCFGVIDLGTHPRPPYLGKPKDPARMLFLMFEFTEEKRVFKDEKGPEPMVKAAKYTYFTDEKSGLAKLLRAWLGQGVNETDFSKLPGKPASLTITHDKSESNGKVYDNISAVAPMSEKLIPLMPPMYNAPLNFSIDENGFESKEFQALYPWIQNMIKESAEYKEFESGPASPQQEIADPPF